MRRIVTAITAAALSLSLVSTAMPANAAAGFDSAYAGESAFLTLNPGQSGTFTVFFANTGTNSWTKGTATQVDLAACLENKTTCDAQDASEAPFNSGWLSATRYASSTQTTVAPGSIGTFTYNVAVPSGQAAGTYRFNGALVVSATAADVHNEGYYQDVTVPAVAGSCAPDAISLAPSGTSNATVGSQFTLTATATCAGAAKTPSTGTNITFFIQSTSGTPPNPSPLTLTANTGTDGKASVSYTRANPDIETAQAYPTANPALRSNTATVQWAAAQVVTVTPKDAASLTNSQCRTYTVTLRSQTTGAVVEGSTALRATFTQKRDSDTSTDANATINGVQPTNDTGTAPSAVELGTTNASGQTNFTVCGTTTTATPIVWREDATAVQGNPASTATLSSTEFRDTGGASTFSITTATTLAVTPDTAATITTGGTRVFTITATDQTGAAFSGNVIAGTVENQDTDLTNDRPTCNIAWFSNGTDLRSSPTSTNPSTNSGQLRQAFALNSAGMATFGLTCTTAVAATAVAWQDTNGDGGLQSGEPQDTGGVTTFSASAGIASGTATFSTRTIAASSNDNFGGTPTNTGAGADSGSAATNCPNGDSTSTDVALVGVGSACLGEVNIAFTLRDAGGNAIAASTDETVNVTIQNTSTNGNPIYIHDLRAGLSTGAAGAQQPATQIASCVGQVAPFAYPCRVNAGTSVSATIAVDSTDAGGEGGTNGQNFVRIRIESTSSDGSTSTTDWAVGKVTFALASNATVTANGTATWVQAAEEPNTAPGGTLTTAAGTVSRTATGQTASVTNGIPGAANGSRVYILKTAVGYMRVTFQEGDTFIVTGTATTRSGFSDNLSTGDSISFTDDAGADNSAGETHNITTNQ